MSTKLDELILKFSDQSGFREKFAHPVQDGDFIVATEAHVLMVAPTKYFENTYIPATNFVDYKKIIPEHNAIHCEMQIDVAKVLEFCKDLKEVAQYNDCDNCDGDGFVVCLACDHEHECKDCNGTGKGGKILYYQYPQREMYIQIKGRNFDACFIKMLCEVSKAIEQPLVISYWGDLRASVFYCADILMLAMPSLADYDTEDTKILFL